MKKIWIILGVILIILFFGIYQIYQFVSGISACWCREYKKGMTENIDLAVDNINKYCEEIELSEGQIKEYTKTYKKSEGIEAIFRPVNRSKTGITCDMDRALYFKNNLNQIIACHCGK